MANPSPPSHSSTISIVILLLLTTIATVSVAADLNTINTHQELETMLETLKRDGYALFPNAIATSDLKFQLLATIINDTASSKSEEPASQLTLFAPTDDLLFALDMASDAYVYVNTLRYHIIPNRRYTFADLRNLTSPFLETLLPHYSVLIGKTLDGRVAMPDNVHAVGIMVDGVRINRPDLFVGLRIVVHGIDGILFTELNLNHQFLHDENSSDLAAPADSPPEMPGPGWNIQAAFAPAASSNGKTRTSSPGILQDKTKKRSAGRKKTGRRRGSGGESHGLRPKRHHRHRLEEL